MLVDVVVALLVVGGAGDRDRPADRAALRSRPDRHGARPDRRARADGAGPAALSNLGAGGERKTALIVIAGLLAAAFAALRRRTLRAAPAARRGGPGDRRAAGLAAGGRSDGTILGYNIINDSAYHATTAHWLAVGQPPILPGSSTNVDGRRHRLGLSGRRARARGAGRAREPERHLGRLPAGAGRDPGLRRLPGLLGAAARRGQAAARGAGRRSRGGGLPAVRLLLRVAAAADGRHAAGLRLAGAGRGGRPACGV